MQLNRKAFLAAVKTVEPALATKDLLPLFKMLWFDGISVRATDGVIGIEAPCETDFKGGLPGSATIGFIESIDRDQIKAETDDGRVTFVSDRARIKLALEPIARLVWPFPPSNAEPEAVLALDAKWREALSFIMTSVDNSAEQEQRRGVTFEAGKSSLNVYATDGTSISWAEMEEKWTMNRACLPGDFIKEVLRIMPEGSALDLRETGVEAHCDAGQKVFSKLFDVEKPIPFGKRINGLLKDRDMMPIPDGLKAALNRVSLLKDSKDDVQAKFVLIGGDVLVVEAASSYGDLKEELYLEADHPEVAAFFTPDILLRGLDKRDQFFVSDSCVVLNGPEHLTYFAAAYTAKSK